MEKNTKHKVRLTKDINPIVYKITLIPDLEGFLYKGEEVIKIKINKKTTEIVLHARELLIDHTKVFLSQGKLRVGVKELIWKKENETVSFVLNSAVLPGIYNFYIEFEGKLSDSLRGFYRAKYEHEGKQKFIATTQFEATDARAAFPCFDEPAKKAKFEVSFVIPKHLEAISNTVPVSVEEHSGNYKKINFASTPIMSTYLLAFIVGEFEFLEGKTKDGIQVRVFVTQGKKHQAKFALDVSIRTLEFFNKFFGIKYPLKNLDMIGIPDFAAGAMENWGAVTYRESQLLVDELQSSASTKQWTALTIAHELAHQWFGNLVTMEWWTHLWLNEGFASYIEYVAVDHLFPEWEIWKQFVYIDFNTALELDCLDNTHPVEVEVHHPDEIGEIFDAISYHKGASIIRMLAEYLGEDNFKKGLSYYLKIHAYGNAETDDLWKAFEKISKKPVRNLMKIWTSKSGYPYLDVKQSKKGFIYKQGRFLSNPKSQAISKDKTIWGIPLEVSHAQGKAKILINKKSGEINHGESKNWIKLNSSETTPVRINYSPEILDLLIPQLESNKLNAIDRLGLIRDRFAFAENGKSTTVEALKIAQAYKNDRDYNVWAELSTRLSELNSLFHDEKFYPALDSFIGELYIPLVEHLGFSPQKNEPHITSMFRSLALSQAGIHKNESVINWAKKQFRQIDSIHPDLRGVVYGLAVKYGGEQEFNKLLNRYKQEQMAEERNRLARGLGQTQNRDMVSKLLEFSLSSKVKLQDAPSLIASTWSNHNSWELVFAFIKNNWKYLSKTYGDGGHTLSRIIMPAKVLHTHKHLQDFKKFFTKNEAPGAKRTVLQVSEQIESNILWLARDKNPVKKFLTSKA